MTFSISPKFPKQIIDAIFLKSEIWLVLFSLYELTNIFLYFCYLTVWRAQSIDPVDVAPPTDAKMPSASPFEVN
jgi:hypothetical protein